MWARACLVYNIDSLRNLIKMEITLSIWYVHTLYLYYGHKQTVRKSFFVRMCVYFCVQRINNNDDTHDFFLSLPLLKSIKILLSLHYWLSPVYIFVCVLIYLWSQKQWKVLHISGELFLEVVRYLHRNVWWYRKGWKFWEYRGAYKDYMFLLAPRLYNIFLDRNAPLWQACNPWLCRGEKDPCSLKWIGRGENLQFTFFALAQLPHFLLEKNCLLQRRWSRNNL